MNYGVTNSNKKIDFFISYSRDVYDSIVLPLINELEIIGFNIWIDKTDVILGSNIFDNIFNVMKTFPDWIGSIIIIDQSYFNKSWCKLEFDFLIKNNVKLLPVLSNIYKEDIPEIYSEYKDLNYARYDNKYHINDTVNKILEVYITERQVCCDIIPIKNPILDILVTEYKKISNNDIVKMLASYNVALAIKNIILTSYQEILSDYNILFNIIEYKMKIYLTEKLGDRHDILLCSRVASLLIDELTLN